ncbi:MAG: DUF2088 domain-containing protein [Armatimonadetes bacterium]|nr:DUF2088 domain-containing protein [Armatimonadota bacterium]
MALVRQRLYSRPISDIPAAIAREMAQIGLKEIVRPGETIAVAAGSRGIAHIDLITREVVRCLEAAGARPFVFPAMGSHGGATAEGQTQVLASLGITEGALQAPIVSNMEAERIGETPSGVPAYMNRPPLEADGVVAINRIKRHTDFTGKTESGLLKMLAVGMGKRLQAEAVHAYGTYGLREIVPQVARVVLGTGKIRFGLGILEDGYDETCRLTAVLPEAMEPVEQKLLRQNKRRFPRLPFEDIDVLIVEKMGKDISGGGMDPNIMGRVCIQGENWVRRPRVHTLAVLDLTEATHGNGVGLGFADFTVQRLIDKIDWQVTLINALVSGFLDRMKVPVTLPNDRALLEACADHNRRKRPQDLRIVRIKDTLHIDEMHVSEPLLEEAARYPAVCFIGEPNPLRFDDKGALLPG